MQLKTNKQSDNIICSLNLFFTSNCYHWENVIQKSSKCLERKQMCIVTILIKAASTIHSQSVS